MYQSLYRKYRPTYFDEVVGQNIIKTTLKNAIQNNQMSHAYLFTGPRGTGKTSVAKILAKTINCENLIDLMPCNKCVCCTQINNKQAIDIIEIDAASNNGVDEIRELKSKVNLVPSIGKYKVYIIDEVHMLTTGAFNALLKTLEEPPDHIIFILATTEPQKIPLTIISRCQRFDFKKIHENDIYKRLKHICELENIKIDDDSLIEISRLSDGGLRDALTLLDQVNAYAIDKITIDDVHEINGTLTPLQLKKFVEHLNNNEIEELFHLIDSYNQSGKNFVKLAEELILFLRNCLLHDTAPSYFKESISDFDLYEITNLNKDKILELIHCLNQTSYDMKLSSNPKILFETSLIEIMDLKDQKKDIKDKFEIEEEKNITTEVVVENKSFKENTEILKKEQKNKVIKKISQIRINNTLCQFSKKELILWKDKIKEIESELINPEYGQYISLILDGNLKAVGKTYFIFVYENSSLVELFNENLLFIDKFLEKFFEIKICAIATSQEEWDIIKKEFNSKSKKYEYVEEPFDLLNCIKTDSKKDEIENIFENIIEYEN